MIIDNLEKWARDNAGRMVKVKSMSHPTGRVVGFKRETGYLCLDGGSGRLSATSTTVFVIDADRKAPVYRWVSPMSIVEFLDGPIKKAASVSGRTIAEFPHVCPACKGPAYIGFNTTVACQKNCGVKSGLL